MKKTVLEIFVPRPCAVSNLLKSSAVWLAATIMMIISFVQIQAAPGDLDTAFGSGGKVTTTVGTGRDLGQAVAVQADGKIVVVGYAQNDFAVVRFNVGGTLDTSFGTNGKILTPVGVGASDEAYAVAIQSDGKIVVAGWSYINFSSGDFALVRYNADGTLDTDFGISGKVITPVGAGTDLAEAIAIQADGKIVVVGWTENNKYAVVRYTPAGVLDSNFGNGGKVITQVNSSGGLAHTTAIQADGKILVGGDSGEDVGQTTLSRFTLLRFNSDGMPDLSFGTNGKVITPIGTNRYGSIFDIAIQPDGKIIASGGDNSSSNGNTAVVRYNTNGSLDAGFGTGGIATTRVGTIFSTGEAIALQSNGKIVVAGDSYSGQNNDFGAARFNADGSIDSSFGTGGKVITPIGNRDDEVRDAAIQSDGKIVVIGHSENSAAGFNEDFAVVRYIGDDVVSHSTPFDFDGDGKTDISIFRPSGGEWWYVRSSNGGNYAAQFGNASDKLTPGDFTGDGKTDIALFRPSTGEWFVLRSEDGSFYSFAFGANGDIPAVGDFDADGKADNAVFRPSTATWFIRRSTDGGATIQTFGQAGDVPVVADYDGDGKADIAIYRVASGEWWINRSTAGLIAFQFGNSSDKPVQGDYTGDGKADVALFRPSTNEWFVLRSENQSYYSFPFGAAGDVPAPGDYDGDGRFDATVFRPSTNTWYSQRTTAGTLIQAFGVAGDAPVPNAFVP